MTPARAQITLNIYEFYNHKQPCSYVEYYALYDILEFSLFSATLNIRYKPGFYIIIDIFRYPGISIILSECNYFKDENQWCLSNCRILVSVFLAVEVNLILIMLSYIHT